MPKTAREFLETTLGEVDAYMIEAPEEMSKKQILYIFNLVVTITFIYLMGTYPDDHFYTFYGILVPLFYAIRLVEFIKIGHYFYFSDLCYIGTYMQWLFVVFYPKNE